MKSSKQIKEAISLEQELLSKLVPLSETDIFDFMKNLRGGTYFNMGMYSFIPVSRAYKKTLRIYKVINMTAIVSGVSYENIGTTKDFRDRTGKAASSSWYNHVQGYENKIGVKKSDPNSKYVLWDIKVGTGNWVRYYVVDIATGVVTPVSKEDVMNSGYLTESEKAKLTPKKVEGFDKTTGELIENQTNWRTAAFEHIFWLSQGGKNTKEYGTKFMENKEVMNKNTLEEASSVELFRDAHANVTTDLDAILSGSMDEDYQKILTEEPNTVPEVAYVIKTDDGPGYEDVYLAWSNNRDGYITVEYIDEIGDGDYSTDIDYIVQNAKDANSMTLGGWEAPMRVVKVTNFSDVYLNGEVPKEEIVQVLDFGKKSESKNLKESYRRIISRGKNLVNNDLFVDFD